MRVYIDGEIREMIPVCYQRGSELRGATGGVFDWPKPVFDIPGYRVIEVIGGPEGCEYVAHRE